MINDDDIIIDDDYSITWYYWYYDCENYCLEMCIIIISFIHLNTGNIIYSDIIGNEAIRRILCIIDNFRIDDSIIIDIYC